MYKFLKTSDPTGCWGGGWWESSTARKQYSSVERAPFSSRNIVAPPCASLYIKWKVHWRFLHCPKEMAACLVLRWTMLPTHVVCLQCIVKEILSFSCTLFVHLNEKKNAVIENVHMVQLQIVGNNTMFINCLEN